MVYALIGLLARDSIARLKSFGLHRLGREEMILSPAKVTATSMGAFPFMSTLLGRQ